MLQGNLVRVGVCTEPVPASCLFVLVPRGAQCGRKDVGALWTHRGVLVTSEPASVCWAGHPARVCRGWWWWQGALLGGGPRLLASDSAPSGRVAVDVPPSRAWPPAICKAPEWSVLKFHSIICSTFFPKADCYSQRGGNSPGLQRLSSVIKY